MVSVSLVSGGGFLEWERFVAEKGGGPLHLPAWHGILRDAFSVEPLFLQAHQDDGSIAGVLPLYLSRSIVTGRHLASLEGGVFATDACSATALLAKANSLRRRFCARYLLLRDAPKEATYETSRTHMVRRVIATSAGADVLWRSLKSHTRNKIRRGERAGYSSSIRRDTRALNDFYQIFARRMHQLGTPVVPLRFFTAMAFHLGSAFSLFTVEKAGEVCGGLVCVAASVRASILYASVKHQDMDSYANYLMYWRVIEHFAKAGMPSLDFGTNAVGSHSDEFKSAWPAQSELLDYNTYADSVGAVPTNIRTATEKGLAQQIWCRVPLRMANLIGPVIRAQLPFG
jgi:hypothetical protein